MALVEIIGWGTDLMVTPISDDLFSELTEMGVTDERMMEIEDNLWLERWRWSGFASDNSLFHILVDGKEIDLMSLGSDTKMTLPPYQVIPPGFSYLVVEETLKGCWLSARSRKKFRPDLLIAACDTVILPNGVKYEFLGMCFDGKDDFGGTVGKDREAFVVSAEGKKYNLKLI
jgi:hypothetical protein